MPIGTPPPPVNFGVQSAEFVTKKQAAQNQHFVPQFLLKGFCEPGGHKASVYSLERKSGFKSNVRNIMAERRFYEMTVDERFLVSWEQAMGSVEQLILPEYDRLVEERTLLASPEAKLARATLIAHQLLRTRKFRDYVAEMSGAFESLVRQGSDTPLSAEPEKFEVSAEGKLAYRHVRLIQDLLPEAIELIFELDEFLSVPPSGKSFLLSDAPVSMLNEEEDPSGFGNVGLGRLGIQLHMPLSRNLQLSLICPSITEKSRDAKSSFESAESALTIMNPMNRAGLELELEAGRPAHEDMCAVLEAIDLGKPVMIGVENLEFYNSLQVLGAWKHVVSPDGDFADIKRYAEGKQFGSRQQVFINAFGR